jgi:hypothetical protein
MDFISYLFETSLTRFVNYSNSFLRRGYNFGRHHVSGLIPSWCKFMRAVYNWLPPSKTQAYYYFIMWLTVHFRKRANDSLAAKFSKASSRSVIALLQRGRFILWI